MMECSKVSFFLTTLLLFASSIEVINGSKVNPTQINPKHRQAAIDATTAAIDAAYKARVTVLALSSQPPVRATKCETYTVNALDYMKRTQKALELLKPYDNVWMVKFVMLGAQAEEDSCISAITENKEVKSSSAKYILDSVRAASARIKEAIFAVQNL